MVRFGELCPVPDRLASFPGRELPRHLDRLPSLAPAGREPLGLAFAEGHPHRLPPGQLAPAGHALREWHEKRIAHLTKAPSAVVQTSTGRPISDANC